MEEFPDDSQYAVIKDSDGSSNKSSTYVNDIQIVS